MELNFKGKRALVTGAGRGIGRAVVKRLTELGADVVALSKTAEHLATLQQEVPTIQTVCVDVTDWTATRKAVEAIGHVDLLVNNAGCWAYGPFDQITEENFDKLFAVHVKAPLNITQVVAQKMKEKGSGGAIVNVSTGLAISQSTNTALYGASKAAGDFMARTMALELGSYNIRVNTVNPGLVKTEMSASIWQNEIVFERFMSKVPLGRVCEVSDVVSGVLYLLSDEAKMVTGIRYPMDGAMRPQ